MQNFHDVSFPDFLARAASASVSYFTYISESVSGSEIRKIERDIPIRKYVIKNILCTLEEYQDFISFFQSRKGRGYAFRFKDYFDYKVKIQKLIVKDKFITAKYYPDKSTPNIRSNIFTIIETLQVKYNNFNLAFKQENINQFTLQTPFSEEKEIDISFEFDVVVRFNQDEVQYHLDVNGAVIIENIELIEILL